MRNFSEFEKSVIKYILYGGRNTTVYLLGNAYAYYLEPRRAKYCKGSIVFYRKEEELATMSGVDDLLEIGKGVVQITGLVQYLIDNHYVYPYETNSVNTLDSIGYIGEPGETPIQHPLNAEITAMINRFINQPVIISHDLIELEKRGFISEEERRHQEAMRVTRRSLKIAQSSFIIAWLGVVASILIPLITIPLSTKYNNKNARATIVHSQFDSLWLVNKAAAMVHDSIDLNNVLRDLQSLESDLRESQQEQEDVISKALNRVESIQRVQQDMLKSAITTVEKLSTK